jgi:hypothetical protein
LIPNLFTGQPAWLIVFCVLLAGGYAAGLYFRERKNEFAFSLKILLGFARFIAIFLISFMLLSPFIRSVSREKEKPVIILALDNSRSVMLNADSNAYRSTFLKEADQLAENLTERGEVRRYIFGDKPHQLLVGEKFSDKVNYDDKVTDISGLIAELGDLYTNMNVGSLIIATDGIYNTGANPVYQAGKWPYPIYSVALGDTSSRKDLILAKVNFNRVVYLNNRFPMEIVVRAAGAAGEQSRLQITNDGNVLQAQDFVIDKDDYTQTFQFVLDAKKSGLQKFSIQLGLLQGELSTENNRKDIYVEVIDSKSRILLISGAPHPDLSALHQAIGSNENYEVDEVLLEDFSGKVEDYSMVILHQLPSADEPAEALLRSVSERKIPALFILGMQSDLPRFNQRKSGLSLAVSTKPVFEEAVPVFNPAFSAFSISENTMAWFAELPPLIAPLGEYQVSNAARVLLNQRIGSIETSRPLILVNETLDGRTAVIAGEGLWKWRLYNYARTQNHDSFNELVNKVVQYLSLKDQKKNFRIYHQGNFRENEHIVFDAEVYNESFELTVEPEVSITIQNEEGNQFPFVFNKSGNSYRLDAGLFPPGNYSYQSQSALGGIMNNTSGQFSVSSIDLEALNTIADHSLLFQVSENSGGKMYFPSGMDQLAADIMARDDIRPVTYARKKYEDLLNKGWLLALIIGLLTMEWFLRKRAGSY